MAKAETELTRCRKRLSDALDVLENVKYACDHGDDEILEAAYNGAVRELNKNGRVEEDDE